MGTVTQLKPKTKRQLKKDGLAMITLEPIPDEQLAEWNLLVERGRQLVEQKNNVTFELLLLAGEIESEYGDGRLARWAEEIGIAVQTAKNYRSLYQRGVDREFVEQWRDLGYARIRAIIDYNGRAANPSAQYWLQYAMTNSISRDALWARMLDFDTNQGQRDERLGSFKLAMAEKAAHERMRPELRTMLEEFVEENLEENPKLADVVLETKFLTPDGVKELEEIQKMAGIKSEEYLKQLNQIAAMARKIKSQRRWWIEHVEDYIVYLEETGNDIQYAAKVEELTGEFEQLLRVLEKATDIKPPNWDIKKDQVFEAIKLKDSEESAIDYIIGEDGEIEE